MALVHWIHCKDAQIVAVARKSTHGKAWYWRSLAMEMNAAGIWAEGQRGPWTVQSLRRWMYRHAHAARPTSRSQCPEDRPCPWVSCRYHLALDVAADGGLRVQRTPVERMRESCALDLATRGGLPLEAVAEAMGRRKSSVSRWELHALALLRQEMGRRDEE